MKKLFLFIVLLIGFLGHSQIPAKFKDGIVIGSFTEDPAVGKAGQIFWDSDDMKFRKHDGSVWSDLIPPAGAEANNLSTSVTWVNVPDANITQSSVTQHQAALSIAIGQITGFTNNSTNWDTAFGWGNHASAGYSTGAHFTPTSLLTDYSFTDNSTNWNTAFGWGNHASAGYSTGAHFTPTSLLTDYSFTDNSSNWNTAFGWGNHASAGYVLQSTYDANTILYATTDDTPTTLTVNAQTLVGRITSGNIASLTQSQVHTLLADRILENATVTTTQTLDYAAYEIFNFTVTGDVTFSESNLPTSGSYGKVILINITGNHALTYPANWSTNITGTYDGTVNNIIAVWYVKTGIYKVQITQPD